jgi:hypothetical protein
MGLGLSGVAALGRNGGGKHHQKACIPYLQRGANHTGPAVRRGDYSPAWSFPYLTYRRRLRGPQIPDLELSIPYRQGGAMTTGEGRITDRGSPPHPLPAGIKKDRS